MKDNNEIAKEEFKPGRTEDMFVSVQAQLGVQRAITDRHTSELDELMEAAREGVAPDKPAHPENEIDAAFAEFRYASLEKVEALEAYQQEVETSQRVRIEALETETLKHMEAGTQAPSSLTRHNDSTISDLINTVEALEERIALIEKLPDSNTGALINGINARLDTLEARECPDGFGYRLEELEQHDFTRRGQVERLREAFNDDTARLEVVEQAIKPRGSDMLTQWPDIGTALEMAYMEVEAIASNNRNTLKKLKKLDRDLNYRISEVHTHVRDDCTQVLDNYGTRLKEIRDNCDIKHIEFTPKDEYENDLEPMNLLKFLQMLFNRSGTQNDRSVMIMQILEIIDPGCIGEWETRNCKGGGQAPKTDIRDCTMYIKDEPKGGE